MLEAYWGDVRLDVVDLDDDAGRSVVTHVGPYQNGGTVEDTGGNPRVYNLRCVFTGPDHLQRLRAFLDLRDSGGAWSFWHPLYGNFPAYLGDCRVRAAAEPRDTVHVDCAFHEDRAAPAVFEAGPGTPSVSGVDDVAASAATLDAAAAGAGGAPLDTSVGADAVATAQAWQNGGVTAQEVTAGLGTVSAKVARFTDEAELATTPSAYPLIAATVGLVASLRRAAQAALALTPRLMEMTPTAPLPLHAALLQAYGGAREAASRYDEVLALNSIANPLALDVGIPIKLPAPRAPRSPR
jgi:prophage DNA circulation protein